MQSKLIGGTIAAVAAGLLSTATASANERHFTYTYETPNLPAGVAEIEPWTTWRFGREDYYSRFDHRLEFEVGLTDQLQTALYMNFTGLSQDVTLPDGSTERVSEFEYEGVSSEWKLNLLNPVADPVGLALYGEVTLAPQEYEIEAKILVDKRMGDVLLAGNLVFENEWELEAGETETEQIIEIDLAGGYFLTDALMIGLEVRNHTELPEGEFEHSAFFAGPVIAFAGDEYWMALTVMPQIAAISGEEEAPGEEDNLRDLEEHEAVNARVLFGFHL